MSNTTNSDDALPEDWTPSDNMTAWDWDDAMIWEMKTRIEDLEPRNVEVMWRKAQEYRHWIQREEEHVERLSKRNAELEAALERIAAESNLGMSVYLSSSEMTRDYMGKVARMKQAAADALAAYAAEQEGTP